MGLRRLGALAVARGIDIDLVVVGGAAMVLGFGAREATKDVDVVIRAPAAAIEDIARAALAYGAIHLVRAAATMPRTRARVQAESPEPLRKRNVFAPAEYATFV